MARRVVVRPQADLDIQASAIWYENQQAGLGARFLGELDLVLNRLGDNPRQFPAVEGEVRRALLRHFPYGVYFIGESEDCLRVGWSRKLIAESRLLRASADQSASGSEEPC